MASSLISSSHCTNNCSCWRLSSRGCMPRWRSDAKYIRVLSGMYELNEVVEPGLQSLSIKILRHNITLPVNKEGAGQCCHIVEYVGP